MEPVTQFSCCGRGRRLAAASMLLMAAVSGSLVAAEPASPLTQPGPGGSGAARECEHCRLHRPPARTFGGSAQCRCARRSAPELRHRAQVGGRPLRRTPVTSWGFRRRSLGPANGHCDAGRPRHWWMPRATDCTRVAANWRLRPDPPMPTGPILGAALRINQGAAGAASHPGGGGRAALRGGKWHAAGAVGGAGALDATARGAMAVGGAAGGRARVASMPLRQAPMEHALPDAAGIPVRTQTPELSRLMAAAERKSPPRCRCWMHARAPPIHSSRYATSLAGPDVTLSANHVGTLPREPYRTQVGVALSLPLGQDKYDAATASARARRQMRCGRSARTWRTGCAPMCAVRTPGGGRRSVRDNSMPTRCRALPGKAVTPRWRCIRAVAVMCRL